MTRNRATAGEFSLANQDSVLPSLTRNEFVKPRNAYPNHYRGLAPVFPIPAWMPDQGAIKEPLAFEPDAFS